MAKEPRCARNTSLYSKYQQSLDQVGSKASFSKFGSRAEEV